MPLEDHAFPIVRMHYDPVLLAQEAAFELQATNRFVSGTRADAYGKLGNYPLLMVSSEASAVAIADPLLAGAFGVANRRGRAA